MPLLRTATSELFHAEQPVLVGFQSTHISRYAGVSTRHLVLCRLWSLVLFSSPKFEQTLYGDGARDAVARLEKPSSTAVACAVALSS